MLVPITPRQSSGEVALVGCIGLFTLAGFVVLVLLSV
jgi:hypothetical protein